MDECDVTDDAVQAELDRGVKEATRLAAVVIDVEYVCRECGEQTTGGRWCGAGCRDIYVRRSGI